MPMKRSYDRHYCKLRQIITQKFFILLQQLTFTVIIKVAIIVFVALIHKNKKNHEPHRICYSFHRKLVA